VEPKQLSKTTGTQAGLATSNPSLEVAEGYLGTLGTRAILKLEINEGYLGTLGTLGTQADDEQP